jgi:hypothetical protein
MITKIAPEKTEPASTGKTQEVQLPKGYLSVTGYANRATRRAHLKALRKQKKI